MKNLTIAVCLLLFGLLSNAQNHSFRVPVLNGQDSINGAPGPVAQPLSMSNASVSTEARMPNARVHVGHFATGPLPDEAGQRFGSSFDADGTGSIITGMHNRTARRFRKAGIVLGMHIIRHGETNQYNIVKNITMDITGCDVCPQKRRDLFGAGVKLPQKDASGKRRLYVAAPGADGVNVNMPKSGMVIVFYETDSGSFEFANGHPILYADSSAGIQRGSEVGYGLELHDLDGNGVEDLIVGVIGDKTGGKYTGAVHTLFMEETPDSSGRVRVKNTYITNYDNFLAADSSHLLLRKGSFGFEIEKLGDHTSGEALFAISAPTREQGQGLVYIVRMNRKGHMSLVNFLAGNGSAENYGRGLAYLGRIGNGADVTLAIGAPKADVFGWQNTGMVEFVTMDPSFNYLGKHRIFSFNLRNGVSTGVWPAGKMKMGWSIVNLGDLTGDSFPNILIGMPGADGIDGAGGPPERGFVYLTIGVTYEHPNAVPHGTVYTPKTPETVWNEQSFQGTGAIAYPNPTASTLAFQVEGVESFNVRIVSMLGQTVHLSTGVQASEPIALDGLTPGNYFAILSFEGKPFARVQVVKQ